MNCLTKEEFERWSRSPSLVRQGSQIIQSPLNSSSSVNEVIKSSEAAVGAEPVQTNGSDGNGDGCRGAPANSASGKNERENKAMALMVQPSVDYGKCFGLVGLRERGREVDARSHIGEGPSNKTNNRHSRLADS